MVLGGKYKCIMDLCFSYCISGLFWKRIISVFWEKFLHILFLVPIPMSTSRIRWHSLNIRQILSKVATRHQTCLEKLDLWDNRPQWWTIELVTKRKRYESFSYLPCWSKVSNHQITYSSNCRTRCSCYWTKKVNDYPAARDNLRNDDELTEYDAHRGQVTQERQEDHPDKHYVVNQGHR